MLKIEISFNSLIYYKNAKSKLSGIFKKVYFTKLLFVINLLLQKKIQKYNCASNKKIHKNKITLIRSPFHYKNSKTIIHSPNQFSKIVITLFYTTNPIFFSKDVLFFFKYLNKNHNKNIKTIKFTHNVKF